MDVPEDTATASETYSGSDVAADIVDGRLLVPYGRSGAWRLAAFDTKTGKRGWDVKLPGLILRDLTVHTTGQRVYVIGKGDVSIFGVADGKLLATSESRHYR